jgi:hypothetical protein
MGCLPGPAADTPGPGCHIYENGWIKSGKSVLTELSFSAAYITEITEFTVLPSVNH